MQFFESGHVVEKIERLEHHADVRTVSARAAFLYCRCSCVIEYIAGGRSLKEVYAAEQSGFARARRADDARDIAGD